MGVTTRLWGWRRRRSRALPVGTGNREVRPGSDAGLRKSFARYRCPEGQWCRRTAMRAGLPVLTGMPWRLEYWMTLYLQMIRTGRKPKSKQWLPAFRGPRRRRLLKQAPGYGVTILRRYDGFSWGCSKRPTLRPVHLGIRRPRLRSRRSRCA